MVSRVKRMYATFPPLLSNAAVTDESVRTPESAYKDGVEFPEVAVYKNLIPELRASRYLNRGKLQSGRFRVRQWNHKEFGGNGSRWETS